ncbi:MAG TPA: hypothetical protein VGJ95_24910 [Pseudonocardiaceae bacterium]
MVQRRAGWWGIAFVVGVFIAAAVVSLPASSATPARIAAFYQQHAAAVIVTQLVGLAAAVAFVMFLRTVLAGELTGATGQRMLWATGGLVVVGQLLTAAPVLALALLRSAEPVTWTRLTELSELADDVLFVAIALFCAELAWAATQLWLRIFAGAVAALALGRGVDTSFGASVLDPLAPSAFLLLMLVISIRVLARRPAPAGTAGQPSAPDMNPLV